MDCTQLKQAIADVIKTNGQQEITGQLLQDALFAIIDTLNNGKQDAGVVFYAIFGETTFAEILAAYNNGSIVVCRNGNLEMRLTSVTSVAAKFTAIVATPDVSGYYVQCSSENSWISGTFRVTETYYATYGESSYMDVLYHAGDLNQLVYSLYENQVYLLTDKGDSMDETLVFVALDGTTLKQLTLSTNNAWNHTSTPLL